MKRTIDRIAEAAGLPDVRGKSLKDLSRELEGKQVTIEIDAAGRVRYLREEKKP